MIYGIWNGVEKRFVFGIKEPTAEKAWSEFTRKCASWRKYRFEVKPVPKDWVNPRNSREWYRREVR